MFAIAVERGLLRPSIPKKRIRLEAPDEKPVEKPVEKLRHEQEVSISRTGMTRI
jgi:hypothetical protein